MGDRALVVFKKEFPGRKEPKLDPITNFSPTVYLHGRGYRVRELLERALPILRTGDVSYAAARFCGVCHEDDGGDTHGLGIFEPPDDMKMAVSDEFSHGNAGVFIVDVDTWLVKAYSGYGFGYGHAYADEATEEDEGKEPVMELQLDAAIAFKG